MNNSLSNTLINKNVSLTTFFLKLKERVLKEIQIFFETNILEKQQSFVKKIQQLIIGPTPLPDNSSLINHAQNIPLNLQKILKEIKIEMKDQYHRNLIIFKQNLKAITEQKKQQGIELFSQQNNYNSFEQLFENFNNIVILLIYDLEFGEFYMQVFGHRSISQQIKTDSNKKIKLNIFYTMQLMIDSLIQNQVNTKQSFYKLFNLNEERLSSLNEDKIQAEINQQNQTTGFAIIWFSENQKDQEYFENLKKEFPQENKEQFIFTKSKSQFFQLIEEYNYVHIIIPGSLCKNIIEQMIEYIQINQITIFCRNLEYHQEWSKKYNLITSLTISFTNVKNIVEQSIKNMKQFITCNLRELKQLFRLNNLSYYINDGFSQSFLGNLNSVQILQIIQTAMSHLPSEIQTTCFNFLLNNQENLSKVIEQHFQSGEMLINLYAQQKPKFFQLINRILWTLNEPAIIAFSPIITSLRSSLFNYSDNSQESLTLYRGINCNVEQFLKSYKINDIIIFPGFTSTSQNLLTALKFAKKKILLVIKIENTQFVSQKMITAKMRGKNIENISKFSNEKEYLFPCFSAFKIMNCSSKYECTCIEIKFTPLQNEEGLELYLEENLTTLLEFTQNKEKQQQQEQQQMQEKQEKPQNLDDIQFNFEPYINCDEEILNEKKFI